ncbi:hypothetical protein [Thiovibrio frasassiensis]|uniref:Pilus assembly protein PilP n=1 Tax=Thiovibrio frasassiensis TaxID=2984131 RepID=A0A9X4RLP0_9BACT|nr:hypothetical protein [Thiovibrio frasassiensis]MDG4475358.1 hypothetical protein [Thiovibrio frasassiensis]
MTNSVPSKNIFLALTYAVCLCFIGAGNIASAQTEPATPSSTSENSAQSLETALATGQPPPFVYNRERPDPFFPFLSKEIMKAQAELTGTQKFEPGQLTLVAIVSGKRGLIAMVQDSSGVGYVLRKGTKIGETGKVVQIAQDKVIIEQSLKNVTGDDSITRKIEMTLSKEGDK